MTNGKLLLQIIHSKGVKCSYIAERIGISRQGFYNKLSEGSDFKAYQMLTICDILQLTDDETRAIFFALDVDKIST